MLTVGNPKTQKGEKLGYLTGILHLAPARLSGYEVCASRSTGCTAGCLNFSGRGRFTRTQEARIRKTQLWFQDRDKFKADLIRSIEALERKAARENLTPAIRLNGTSDIMWERIWPELFDRFSHIQFYDYTKHGNRWDLPDNYDLTFSRAEQTGLWTVQETLKKGRNVAVVFDNLPDTWAGYPVTNGDETDLRFLDPKPSIVGLKAKGDARHDTSGFVVYMSSERAA